MYVIQISVNIHSFFYQLIQFVPEHMAIGEGTCIHYSFTDNLCLSYFVADGRRVVLLCLQILFNLRSSRCVKKKVHLILTLKSRVVKGERKLDKSNRILF